MAKKSLEEMLTDTMTKDGAKDATKRLATFLSYWDEIESAYKKGWSWVQIYNALHQEGVVDYSYSTFLHYKDKKRRRELEAVKYEAVKQLAGDAKGALADRAAKTPGSAKTEPPLFAQGVKPREPRRF